MFRPSVFHKNYYRRVVVTVRDIVRVVRVITTLIRVRIMATPMISVTTIIVITVAIPVLSIGQTIIIIATIQIINVINQTVVIPTIAATLIRAAIAGIATTATTNVQIHRVITTTILAQVIPEVMGIIHATKTTMEVATTVDATTTPIVVRITQIPARQKPIHKVSGVLPRAQLPLISLITFPLFSLLAFHWAVQNVWFLPA